MHCGKQLEDETQEYCADCSKRKSALSQGYSVWLHRGMVPGAVYRFKYNNRRYCGDIFAEEIVRCFAGKIQRWEIDEIIPVPLHPSRQRKRGFNQAEILAAGISRRTGIPVKTDVLFRIRKTDPQKQLGMRDRKRNIRGAFGVSKKWRPCRNILLIDDIYTTGSTLESAAYLLKKAGAENVFFLTISIGQGI